MRIDSISIRNFRGIRDIIISEAPEMIIVAGQNGSGKSCIFDAIRLLKSVYGGYQQNEWQQWMGEFQIQLTNRSSDFTSMFNDKTKELRIKCEFRLSDYERKYIADNAEELLREVLWRQILPEAYEWGGYRAAMFAAQFREREPEVRQKVDELRPRLMADLAASSLRGECFIPVGGTPNIAPALALQIIFSTYRPSDIGVIDYHGAQRHYGRELVQGINLNLDANQQQRSQSTLYNYAAKYNNVKSEMASSFVKEALAEKAGVQPISRVSLTSTLQELFSTFFPDKEFLGPQPTADGGLAFPVRTASGTHDLDELSAGEKEILYGYLRIRNSAPRHSIILLDEPELHLNPRLIRGLPQFYHKHLGRELGNQIWLVSHSDALLREVVGREGNAVYHMLSCSSVSANDSQLRRLLANADLELALVDLVGDLAAYRPGGKVIIFEGGGDSDFDQRMVSRLFPTLLTKANLISGSNKTRVRALHEILERASDKGQLPFEFYAVTDRDSDLEENTSSSVRRFNWDVYHVENYLLNIEYVGKVVESLLGQKESDEQLTDDLRECARDTLPQLVRHELADYANRLLIGAVDTGTDPKKGDVAWELSGAVHRSAERMQKVVRESLSEEVLRDKAKSLQEQYERALADGTWLAKFRGRDVLKRFVSKRALGVGYEVFRNLVISKMADDGYQPPGMSTIVSKILG